MGNPSLEKLRSGEIDLSPLQKRLSSSDLLQKRWTDYTKMHHNFVKSFKSVMESSIQDAILRKYTEAYIMLNLKGSFFLRCQQIGDTF